MDRSLLTPFIVITIIIVGLILMNSPASEALSQKDPSLLSKIYDKLTYMLWEDKHQSALQVRNELIQQQILDEEIKQTKLLDHLDCILTNEMMHGGKDNPKRTFSIDCNDGYPLNVTGVWKTGYWERNTEGGYIP